MSKQVIQKGYKQTKIGVIPVEWEALPARNYFSKSITKGYEGLEIYSVTLNKSWQKRSELDRNIGSDVDLNKSLLAEKGDLVYNTMRMWQGALGLAENIGVISPAYIVLKPKKTINSKFAFYQLKSYRYLHYLKSYSYGLTSDRLRLYFNDFGMIPFVCPPLKEQQKIAKILTTWDRAIEKQKALIVAKEEFKKGLMQRLLSGENKQWKRIELSEVLEISSKKFNPKKSDENKKCIELEHLSQNSGILLGFTNSREQQSIKNIFQKNNVLYGKLRPYLKKYWKAEFEGVCSTEIWVLNGKSVINDYLFYLVQTNKFNQIANVSSGSKMPRADWKYMAEIPFNIPPLKEQQKIAQILTTADKEIELLKHELEVLREQKRGLMQRLLMGEVRCV